MTLTEAKDLVVKEFGHENFDAYLKYISGTYKTDRPEYALAIVNRLNNAARLYASEKVKEALQLAAERAEITVEYNHRGNEYVVLDKKSILSLETELIEQINKEI